MKTRGRHFPHQERELRVGFVPLADSAPLIVAQELGLFAKYGLDVKLCRELGWATVRDKIVYGELDAAQAVSGLGLATTCGWGGVATPCVTGLILSANGDGITLSSLLYAQGVRDAKTFKHYIVHDAKTPPVLGIVSPFSSHNFLLRQWLRSGGIDPNREVRIVVVPPPQVCQNLKAGNLDGFCVGEPWNSVAVQSRLGWTVATSRDLCPGHPEKTLLVREEFAERRAEQHLALLAALLEACRWCDEPENREQVVSMLCRAEYLNLDAKTLIPSVLGSYDYGYRRRETVDDFLIFHRGGVNEPSQEKVVWIADRIAENGFIRTARPSAEICQRVFRQDVYQRAYELAFGEPVGSTIKTKRMKLAASRA